MKTGVALSGCEFGGVAAYAVLHELKRQGLSFDHIASCGTPSAGALLFAGGFGLHRTLQSLDEFLCIRRDENLDAAIHRFSEHFTPTRLAMCTELSIHALDLDTRSVVSFTNDIQIQSDTLNTVPLMDVCDALSAGVGTVDGLGAYPFQGKKLCDYSVQNGCPVQPLCLFGCERVLSVAFLPARPETAYELMTWNLLFPSPAGVCAHIVIEVDCMPDADAQAYFDFATSKIRSCMHLVLETMI